MTADHIISLHDLNGFPAAGRPSSEGFSWEERIRLQQIEIAHGDNNDNVQNSTVAMTDLIKHVLFGTFFVAKPTCFQLATI